MFTFEDMTASFLKAAGSIGLATHPEFWSNLHSLEREFACICHTGNCEDADRRSSCTASFTWGALDTVMSLDGPSGICNFFHEVARDDCPHLHTTEIPPLVLDLSYTFVLNGTMPSEEKLLTLMQMLKLHASEYSQRTIETRPTVTMILHDNRLQPETLSLQQRVELPIWHPRGMDGLHDDSRLYGNAPSEPRTHNYDHETDEPVPSDMPHPEAWAPQLLTEVCQDILHVLQTLDASIAYRLSDHS